MFAVPLARSRPLRARSPRSPLTLRGFRDSRRSMPAARVLPDANLAALLRALQFLPDLRISGGLDNLALNATDFGPAVFLSAVADCHVAERLPAEHGGPLSSTICVCFGLKGSATLHHRGRELRLGSGDIALVDSDLGFVLETGSGHEEAVLKIPKALIGARLQNWRSVIGSRVSADDPKALAVSTALHGLRAAAPSFAPQDHEAAFHAALHLVDLLTTEVSASGIGEPDIARTRALIRTHIANRKLSVEALADLQHMSRRSLELRCAREGITPNRLIWDTRLECAAEIIAADHHARRKLAAVAVECGFSSPGHFAREFRRKYGVSPRAFRERCHP